MTSLYISLAHSILFSLGLVVSGWFFYIGNVSHSWSGYLQNLSLISLGHRVLFLTLFWVLLSGPFIAYLAFQKKTISKIVTPSLICIGLISISSICLDIYYISKIISIHDTNIATIASVKAKWGNPEKLKYMLRKTSRLEDSSRYGSPDYRYKLVFNQSISKFELLNQSNQSKVMTMAHFVISPGEVFWLVNNKGESTHILYQWAYDQDDLEKVYIANLKTKKTVLLAKGSWLYDLNKGG